MVADAVREMRHVRLIRVGDISNSLGVGDISDTAEVGDMKGTVDVVTE
jgi:hypothetical protein